MNKERFERLNLLSEKAMNQTAEPREIKEFNSLLNEWNSSAEHNLINNFITHPSQTSFDEE